MNLDSFPQAHDKGQQRWHQWRPTTLHGDQPRDGGSGDSQLGSEVSNEQKPGCLGWLVEYTTQLYSYIGIIINHYKDPY